MELLLIRHALPIRVHNRDGSPADPPLGEPGREQARCLAEWLAAEEGIDVLYASPLLRARETAAPLVPVCGSEPRIEAGLTEFDHDSELYIPLEELKASDPELWKAYVRGGGYAGRDVSGFRRTVVASLEAIVAAHPGQRVAAVCHGGVINAWAAHLLRSEALFLFEPGYASISRFLAARSGERSVLSLNERAHLRGMAAAPPDGDAGPPPLR